MLDYEGGTNALHILGMQIAGNVEKAPKIRRSCPE